MSLKHTIYGFSLGNTRRILYKLKNIDCCYILYPNNIDHYLDMLLHDQPPHILGLGSYTEPDQEQIRIETKFSNKYKDGYIEGNDYRELEIQPLLKDSPQMQVTDTINNSFYNFVSWKIIRLIHQQLPNSNYTFLHVPSTMNSYTASQRIDRALL